MIDLLTNGTLDRLERLGRLINAFGFPLIAVAIIAMFFGWMPSPMLAAASRLEISLATHDAWLQQAVQRRAAESEQLSRALERLTDVLKMIDCGDIKDPALRNRCLSR